MRKEKIFKNFLFIAGITLLTFSLCMLGYEIYHTITFQWNQYTGKDFNDARTYFILEYITLVFKIVISSYAIYARKNIDAVVNPLFLFAILFSIFVALQTISYFNIGGLNNEPIVNANAFIDLVVAVIFLTTTFILKIDDWREEEL